MVPLFAALVLAAAPGVNSAKKPIELALQEGHSAAVRSIDLSPDGTRLASGDADGYIKIWDVRLGLAIRTLWPSRGTIAFLGWRPDGRELVVFTHRGDLDLYDTKTWTKQESATSCVSGEPLAFALSGNGKKAAVTCADGKASVLELDDRGPYAKMRGVIIDIGARGMDGVALSDDARVLAVRASAKVAFYESDTGRKLESPLDGRPVHSGLPYDG